MEQSWTPKRNSIICSLNGEVENQLHHIRVMFSLKISIFSDTTLVASLPHAIITPTAKKFEPLITMNGWGCYNCNKGNDGAGGIWSFECTLRRLSSSVSLCLLCFLGYHCLIMPPAAKAVVEESNRKKPCGIMRWWRG